MNDLVIVILITLVMAIVFSIGWAVGYALAKRVTQDEVIDYVNINAFNHCYEVVDDLWPEKSKLMHRVPDDVKEFLNGFKRQENE